ncbi:hypothetical protein EH183_41850 [Streptomyces sp. CB01881]|uniref:hypothetical protein n=1 Tax=Streptomyces sp. CB01881 TaxID=2078691 RepID=UPI0011DF357C|nr:hypothetical protein [Streptomyces sp. CB01881]TYC66544.1 hypothetical protein EH183_41850 [Streptomyces sp. CB01881]
MVQQWGWLWGDTLSNMRPRVTNTFHFSGVSARDELASVIRAEGDEPEYRRVADMIEAATPPLAAVVGADVFFVVQLDANFKPVMDRSFTRKYDAAFEYAVKKRGRGRPKLWD